MVHLHAGRACPVHDENRALKRKGELLEHFERLLCRLERGQMRGGHDHDRVGRVEHREDVLREARGRVDDDVVRLLLQEIDRLLHRGNRDQLGAFR